MSSPQPPNLPAIDILNDLPYGKFVLTNLAAKRAKQLKEGAPALVRIDSSHPLTIALAEIAAGKIKPVLPEEVPEKAVVEAPPTPAIEEREDDFGLLLPSLDEIEDAELLITGTVDEETEEEAEEEALEAAAPELGDLLEETEDVAPEPETDVISTTDYAEQEEAVSEESEFEEL